MQDSKYLRKEQRKFEAHCDIQIFPTWQTTVLDSVSKSITIYIVQKLFDSKMMLDKFLHRATQVQARRCYELLAKHVVDVERKFGGKVGLDAQVSNWFVELDKDEVIGLQYFDVTTPLMRSEKGGKERIDVNVFLCTLPLPIRFAVRNFMLAVRPYSFVSNLHVCSRSFRSFRM